MLLELAVGRHQLLAGQMRLRRRFDQRLDAPLNLAERPGAILETVDALHDLIELAGGARGFLINLFERLSELRELGAAHRDLRQHRAEGTPLFPRGRDQSLEIVALLLRLVAAGQAFDRVQHGVPSVRTVCSPPGHPAMPQENTGWYAQTQHRARFKAGEFRRGAARISRKPRLSGGAPVCRSRGMLATLRSAALFGVEAYPVRIEVDVSFGLPSFTMVGLPDATVRESRDRVKSAIRNSGFEFPPHKITVNLAPADVWKIGASFDLPIALGILAASGVVQRRNVSAM